MIVNNYSGYRGYGAASAVRFELWPGAGVGFSEEWARDNWVGGKWLEHIRYWKVADYTPLSDSVLNRAARKQMELAAAGNDKADMILEQMLGEIKTLAGSVDKSIKNDFSSVGTASDAGHANHAKLLTMLNKAITKFANVAVPAVGEAVPETTRVISDSPRTTKDKPDVVPAYVAATGQSRGALVSDGGGGTRAVVKADMPGWLIPAGIGAGALLLGGITFAIVRKKSNK